jgi:hypothetical protein
LTGYTLVFEEKLDTLSAAQTDTKRDRHGASFRHIGPAKARIHSRIGALEKTMSPSNRKVDGS